MPDGHIDLAKLKATMLENVRRNNADPEARQAWEDERNQHARAVPNDEPLPKVPALNPDGSLQDPEGGGEDDDEDEDEDEPPSAADATARQFAEGLDAWFDAEESEWSIVPEDLVPLLERKMPAYEDPERQLDFFERRGDEYVMVRLVNTDGNVCEICASLENQLYTIDEARGVLPVHPNCKCRWLRAKGFRESREQGGGGVSLLEKKEKPLFTGEITDKLGRRIRFVNGKRVRRGTDDTTGPEMSFRARVNGKKVHVSAYDPVKGLVSVHGKDGRMKIVHVNDVDFDRGEAQPAQQAPAPAPPPAQQAPAQAPPVEKPAQPEKVHAPDPTSINPRTGLADHARVGVPAMQVPPPPADIPRLPNLDKDQRWVESAAIDKYLRDPDKAAKSYLKALKKGKVGVAANVFSTDDAKMLNEDWNPEGAGNLPEKMLPDNVKTSMAKYNAAVHQVANATAKRAFLKYLDALPEGKKSVLVLQGGCGAGKGSTFKHATDPADPHRGMLPAADQVGAVWDSAGEQNSTENEWILDECRKRGIKPTFAYVWAEPQETWTSPSRGVIRRALRKGRMVDARLFADSYAHGAKNMHDFVKKHHGEPGADFIFIDNRDKKNPKKMDGFPEETLAWDAETIYKGAVDEMHRRRAELSPAIMMGGLGGAKIWGPPK